MFLCAEKLEEVWKIAINLCVSMQVFDSEKPWLWKEHEGTIIETRIPRDEVDTFTGFNGATVSLLAAIRHTLCASRNDCQGGWCGMSARVSMTTLKRLEALERSRGQGKVVALFPELMPVDEWGAIASNMQAI